MNLEIRTKWIIVLIISMLLFGSISAVSYFSSKGVFDAEITYVNNEKLPHSIILNIDNQVQGNLEYDIEVLYERENLVVGSKDINCRDLCEVKIDLRKSFFDTNIVNIRTKHNGKYYEKNLKFDLNQIEKNNVLSVPKEFEYLGNGSLEITGSLSLENPSRVFIDIIPEELSDLKIREEINCSTNCDFTIPIKSNIIYGQYMIRAYLPDDSMSSSFRIVEKSNVSVEEETEIERKKPYELKWNILENLSLNNSYQGGNFAARKLELKEVDLQDLPINSFSKNSSFIEILPRDLPINSIIFENLNLKRNNLPLGLAKLNVSNKQEVQKFAIDPEKLEFEKAQVRVIAKGTELHKCKDWNFENQICQGEWSLYKDNLIPGQEYTFFITPDDPGFVEYENNSDEESTQTFNTMSTKDSSFSTTSSGGFSLMSVSTVILFESPTPANNTVQEEGYAPINISINSEDIDQFNYTWDGNTYRVYDDSLKLFYDLDSSSTFTDYSSYSNNGSCSGGGCPTWISDGIYGGAYDFDGNDIISSGNDASLTTGSEFTVSAWLRPAVNNQYMGAVSKLTYGGGDYRGFSLVKQTDNTFQLFVAGGGANTELISSNSAYTDTSTWYHVVGMRRGGVNYLYVDGIRQSATGSQVALDSGQEFLLGRQYQDYTAARWWNGDIDEVKLWDRALSDEEVEQLYLSRFKKTSTNYWHFFLNQTESPSQNLENGTYFYDASFRNSTGTLESTGERVLVVGLPDPVLNIDLLSPSGDVNINQNKTFLVNTNVSCEFADCGATDVSLFFKEELSELEEVDATNYCAVSGNTGDGDYITGVNFNGLSLSKGDSGGYIDRTDLISDLSTPGDSYQLSVSFSTAPGFNSCAFAWIDWNQNDVLENPSEYYALGCGESTTVSQMISVPSGAQQGSTMMRVTIEDSGNTITNSCTSATYGETADVRVAVDSQTTLVSETTEQTPFWTSNSNPSSISLNLNESQLVSWTVNATGLVNTSYNFYAEAEKNSDNSIFDTTPFWKVNITSEEIVELVELDISSPTNNSKFFRNETVSLEINTSSEAQDVWYEINGVSQGSLSQDSLLEWSTSLSSLDVGKKEIQVFANNSQGDISNESINIIILDVYQATITNTFGGFFAGGRNSRINITNYVDFSRNFLPFVFVGENSSLTNPSVAVDSIFSIFGPKYIGEVYGWNRSINSQSSTEILYTKIDNLTSNSKSLVLGLD